MAAIFKILEIDITS